MQSNHLSAAMMAYIKFEKLKFAHQKNHFAMKAKLHLSGRLLKI